LPGATTIETLGAPAAVCASTGRGELIAKIGTIVSAIMASSCCWLPVLLLAVGVSGAGIASALEAYRPIFMVVTFGFLGMAFYFTYRPRKAASGSADCCSTPVALQTSGNQPADCCATTATVQSPAARPRMRFNMMSMNKVMLWGVTVLAIVFLFFPSYLTNLLGSGSEKFTADMTRTEVRIEGMTCEG
jgi:hypothetical protein